MLDRYERWIHRRLRRTWRTGLLVLTATATLVACGGGADQAAGAGAVAPAAQAPAAPAPAPVPAGPPGAETYQKSCARCHGQYLEGKGGTPALTSWRIAGLSNQNLELLFAYGKGQMPAFGNLTPDQISALIAYLRTL